MNLADRYLLCLVLPVRWNSCLILASLNLILWSCQSPPPHVAPTAALIGLPVNDVIREPLDPTFDPVTMDEWGAEVYERFGAGTVIVGCHGSYAVKGDWLVYPILLDRKSVV